MNIFKGYNYLFYRFYCWAKDIQGDITPEYTGLAAVMVFSILNIVTLLQLLFGLFKVRLNGEVHKIFLLPPVIIYMVVFYFIFINNQKYKQLVLEYDKESDKTKKRKTRLVRLYVFVSIVGLIAISILTGIYSRS